MKDYTARLVPSSAISFFLVFATVFSTTASAAPADGLVFWNPADKAPEIILSNGNLDIEIDAAATGGVGVRSNRPIQRGEGMFYLEMRNLYASGNTYSFGIATSDALLQGLNVADTANITPFATAYPAVGMIVDYRSEYPMVHWVADDGSGLTLLDSERLRDHHDDVYIYLAAFRNGQAVVGQPQFRLNFGTAEPFEYDPVAAANLVAFNGDLDLEIGWPVDDDHPQVTITSGDQVTEVGGSVTFTGFASDTESGILSSSINWFMDDVLVGTGSSVSVSPTEGSHLVRAEVADGIGQPASTTARAVAIANLALDSDYDGLTYQEEIDLGTNPGNRDSDFDGLNDGAEDSLGTDPLTSDSDSDGMIDGYEVENTLDPLSDDAAGDLDGDTHDNLTEFLANRSANDPNDFPDHGVVLLNSADAHTNIVLASGDLSFSVTAASGLGAIRSDVAIASGTGWHYFEGYRHTDIGNFGFGVATAGASLTAAAGSDGLSVGVSATGSVTFNGTEVGTLTNPENIEAYGIAVDYAGTTPDVTIMARAIGAEEYQLIGPITMTGVSADLHIFAYGESQDAGVQQSVNAGQDKLNNPFVYSPRYLLFVNGGDATAETMREGWGSEYVYQAPTVELAGHVKFERNSRTSPIVSLSDDGLGAGFAFGFDTKSAVLANQGMIGEFRYWEGHRERDVPSDLGFGLINPYAVIDEYCCVNATPVGEPPSMSVNATGGIWRNLDFEANFDNSNDYYGFAVDYRGSRPIVYTIIGGAVVSTLTLDDFITPIYPMFYANGASTPTIRNSANFGDRPFQYDARQALQNAGVDVTGLITGWGMYDQALNEENGPNAYPTITFTGATAGLTGQPLNVTATAQDYEGTDLTAIISWENNQTADTDLGGSYDFVPPTTGTYRITASVTDTAGLEFIGALDVSVTDTDSTNPVVTVPTPITVDLSSGASLAASDAAIVDFLAAASARDDVDGPISVSNDAPASFPVGTTNVEFSATDSSGNSGTGTSSVTVNDTGAPNMTVPADLSIDLTSGSSLPDTDAQIVAFIGSASASDDVDGSLAVTDDAPATFPLGETTVTFSATDAAGNSSSDSATVTLNDAGEPNITVPTDISLDLPSGSSIPASNATIAGFLTGASADDDVDGTLSVTHDAPTDFPAGVTTVTFSATDAAGNTGSATATVTINDTGAPTVTVPADISIDLASGASVPDSDAAIVAFLGAASATDDVDGTLTVTHDGPASFAVGDTIVTFTATDAAGNSDSASATVTVNDTGAPTVAAPADITVGISSGNSVPDTDATVAAFLSAATADDDVDGSLTVTHDAPASFPIGDTLVTFSGTDAAGNSDSATATVTVEDTGAPSVTTPADISIDLPSGSSVPASDAAIVAFLGGASATDDVDGSLTVSHDAPASFGVGATVVTFSATDAAGNNGSATATVTINDTGAPTITVAADATVGVASGNSVPDTEATIAAFLSGTTAADDVDGALTVTHDAPASFGVGTTVVTFTATDAAGNGASATGTVTVNDTGAPAVSAPSDISIDLAAGFEVAATDAVIVAFLDAASASDDVDGTLSVTHDAPANFPVGDSVVTFSATDAAGNDASATATVTVNDTGAPTVTAPADITVGAATGNSLPDTEATIAAFLSGATADDDVDGSLTVSNDAPASFPMGATTVTFSATDAAGNSDSATATVTLEDTGEPVVTPPADLALSMASGDSIAATDAAIAAFLSGASAADDVDGSLTVTHDAPASFGVGATVVTFSATDAAGNSGTATASVSISDTGAPNLTVPADLALDLPSGANVPATDAAIVAFLSAASATDDVEGTRPVTNDAPATFPPGATTVVTFTSADTAGNSASATASVTVTDTGDPVLTLPDDLVIDLASGNEVPDTDAAILAFFNAVSASDDVDGSLTVTDNAPSTYLPETVTVINFSTVDAAGNSVSDTRTITVNDTGVPSLTVPTPIAIAVETGSSVPASDAAIVAFLAAATASDDVDGTLSVTDDAPADFPIGTTTVTFSATDAAGNTAEATSSVVVDDTGEPTVIAPADLVIDLASGDSVDASDGAIVTFLAAASAVDVVDGTLTVSNDAPATFPMGATLVTFSATDTAGNSASASATVTVNDAGAPDFSTPADISINLASGNSVPASDAAINAFIAAATANDDVDGAVSVTNDAPADFPIGITTVTFDAADAAGNTASTTATVSVVDTGLPSVTTPADLSLSIMLGSSLSASDPAIAAFLTGASAADDVDGTLSVTHDAPADFPVGVTTVEFSAEDAAGNIGTATATVTIVDGGAPTVTAPADIVINLSSGSSVAASNGQIVAFLAGASAVDAVDGTVAVTNDAPATFPIGTTTVTFSATDSVNNTTTATATVTVADTGMPIITPPAGITINIVNGMDVPATDAAIAAFLSAASANDDVDGALPVTHDAPAAFSPGVTTVTFSATDAAGNTSTATSSVAVNITNVAPSVSIEILQGGASVTTVTRDGGLVTITATVTDENLSDSHTFNWGGTDTELLPSGSSLATFDIDPAALTEGVFLLNVIATDNGTAPMAGSATDLIRIIETAPALSSTEDSDGDGTSDADEGAGDADGDRIPDYLDPDSQGTDQLPAGDNGALIEASGGLTLRLGGTAFTIDAADGLLTIEDVEAWATALAGVPSGMDDDYHYPAGIFDIEVTGVPVGGTATITIALDDAIPANATLREFAMAGGWSRFLSDADNLVQSAPGGAGSCPAPGSAEYTDGLTQGNLCIQVQVSDGGSNDADGLADGTIRILNGPAMYIGPFPDVQARSVGLSTTTFSDNDGERVVLDFIVSSDSDDAEIHELMFEASGELNEATTVSSVALYLDANDDGVADASEQIATGSYSSDNGEVSFTLASPQALSNGDNRFLVTYNF